MSPPTENSVDITFIKYKNADKINLLRISTLVFEKDSFIKINKINIQDFSKLSQIADKQFNYVDSYLLPSIQNAQRVLKCFIKGYKYSYADSSVNINGSRASIFLDHLEDDKTSLYTIQIQSFSLQDENNINSYVYFQGYYEQKKITQDTLLNCGETIIHCANEIRINLPKLQSDDISTGDIFVGLNGIHVDQDIKETLIVLDQKKYIRNNSIVMNFMYQNKQKGLGFTSKALMLVFKKCQNEFNQNSFLKECVQNCQDGYFLQIIKILSFVKSVIQVVKLAQKKTLALVALKNTFLMGVLVPNAKLKIVNNAIVHQKYV
ncbi:hypothetical protein ABPG72_004469 [Tetrahymena utriculariae]